MYFVVEQWKNVLLKPAQLGPGYEQFVEDILKSEVEGKCTAQYGYVICVVKLLHKEPGRIQDGSGLIVVTVKYQAVVFKPIMDEVLDGAVTDVNKVGFFAQCGPLKVFVGIKGMPSSYTYDETMLPSYSDSETVIKAQSEVRMRIQGIMFDQGNFYATASIDGDYLGPIDHDSLNFD